MTIDFPTVLVVCALIGSVLLVLQGGQRLCALIALVACGLEALIAFNVLHLSSPKIRIDMILSAVLVVTGAICWMRSAGKTAITAATVVALVGLIQLLHALHVLHGV